jgi:hypothetical protein
MLGDLQQRLRALSPGTVDACLALAVAAAMVLTIGIAEEPGAGRSPDVLAYLLGISVAALLLLRRRWPLGVLIASIGVLSVYFGLDYDAFSAAVPLAAAAYSAAVAGKGLAAAGPSAPSWSSAAASRAWTRATRSPRCCARD